MTRGGSTTRAAALSGPIINSEPCSRNARPPKHARFATDDGAASKETVGLIDSPSGLYRRARAHRTGQNILCVGVRRHRSGFENCKRQLQSWQGLLARWNAPSSDRGKTTISTAGTRRPRASFQKGVCRMYSRQKACLARRSPGPYQTASKARGPGAALDLAAWPRVSRPECRARIASGLPIHQAVSDATIHQRVPR